MPLVVHLTPRRICEPVPLPDSVCPVMSASTRIKAVLAQACYTRDGSGVLVASRSGDVTRCDLTVTTPAAGGASACTVSAPVVHKAKLTSCSAPELRLGPRGDAVVATCRNELVVMDVATLKVLDRGYKETVNNNVLSLCHFSHDSTVLAATALEQPNTRVGRWSSHLMFWRRGIVGDMRLKSGPEPHANTQALVWQPGRPVLVLLTSTGNAYTLERPFRNTWSVCSSSMRGGVEGRAAV